MTDAEANLWARVYAAVLVTWLRGADTEIARDFAAQEADAAVALMRERVKA
jgi:hypothetical protein